MKSNKMLELSYCDLNDYRLLGKSPYQNLNLEQLVERLVEAETLEEQTDILHYLVLCYGLKQKILLPDVSFKICYSLKVFQEIYRLN